MNKEKESKQRFKRIINGKENQGYTNWKKWVLDEIKGYDDEKMQNIIKRYEIKMEREERDERANLFSLVSQYIVIFAALVPYLGNIVLTSVCTQIGVYNFETNAQMQQEFSNIVRNTLQEIGELLSQTGAIVAIGCVILIGLARCVDTYMSGRNSWNIAYYKEMLNVLKEKMQTEERTYIISVSKQELKSVD